MKAVQPGSAGGGSLPPFKGHGLELQLEVERGTIIQVDKESETRVFSVGGGPGYGGQSAVPPVIGTRTDRSERLWYANAAEKQNWISATNHGLRFLAGHSIDILRVHIPKTGWQLSWVHNRATGEQWWLTPPDHLAAFAMPSALWRYPLVFLKAWLLSVLLSLPTFLLGSPDVEPTWEFIPLVTSAYLVFGLLQTYLKASAITRRIVDHVTAATRQIAGQP